MSTWKDLTIDEQRTILNSISIKTGLIENVVEKDWWVSMVLKAIFQSSCAESLVFKGGTSLSKGWSLIERFSEDIDLAIDRSFFDFNGELSNKERTLLRKKSLKYIREELSIELDELLKGMGIKDYSILLPELKESDKDPEIIFVPYTTVLEGINNEQNYVPFQVKVEISCRSLREPYEQLMLRSLIAEEYPEEEFSEDYFAVNTVLPTRTFLEKIFLLHEEFQKKETRSVRMTRHLYDLEKLMDTEFATQATKDTELYTSIVKHRFSFNRWAGVDYRTHHPSTVNCLPPESVIEDWKKDYIDMQENFIYGNSLSFEALIERISELMNRFRSINIDDTFFESSEYNPLQKK